MKMNEVLAQFSMCFAFCFLFEGIETAIKSKANKIYKATHIIYPSFIAGTIFYFLVTGVLK